MLGVRASQRRHPLLGGRRTTELGEEAGHGLEVGGVVPDRPDRDALRDLDLPGPNRGDLEVLPLIHEPHALVQRACRRPVMRDLELDPVRPAQPPLGDDRRDQRPTDPTPAERVADEQVADPTLERRVVQPAPEPKDDEARGTAIGERQVRRRIGIVDERLVRCAMGIGIGVRKPVQLACQRERIGEVLPRHRSDLDALGARHRQAADWTVRIPKIHQSPRSGWRLSVDHRPWASPDISTTSVALPEIGPRRWSASVAASCTLSACGPSASPTVRCGITSS